MGILIRVLPAMLLVLVVSSSALAGEAPLSPEDKALYRDAFVAADDGKWKRARSLAERASDPLLAKVILWLDLTREGSTASFDEIASFMAENPDWPGQTRLEEHAERAMAFRLSDGEVVAWFEAHEPASREGRTRLAQAWRGLGLTEQAIELFRRIWIEDNFPKRDAKAFYRDHKDILRPEDHIARLDRLLWDERLSPARRMLAVVDQGHRALGEARLRLMTLTGGVDPAIAAVPEELLSDPGLAYERLRWRRRKGFDERAREILWAPPDELVRPGKWWRERGIEARELLAEGRYAEAYALARDHGQTEGRDFAEAEWLAGWIALSLLGEEAAALDHFTAMHSAVRLPISVARGAFWAGRALEEQDAFEAAVFRYLEAAQHWQTYYGQLAVARLATMSGESWPLETQAIAATETTLEGHELARVVRRLVEIDQTDRAEPFLLGLVDLAQTRSDGAFAARLALGADRPDLSVAVAKRANARGLTLVPYAYPLVSLPLESGTAGLEDALVLAVVRQESAFDVEAVSGSGARGLMQLLPATARQVAHALKLPVSTKKLTSDSGYNLTLGTTYLSGLIDAYDGSYILALAAYNAGPRHVKRWIERYGDPRESEVDAVDWIELIPFGETRNYIQRVLEGLQTYRTLLGESPSAGALVRDLRRGAKPASEIKG